MTERQLDEAFAAIFGRDGGVFALGAIRCAKIVQAHVAAIRADMKRLEMLSAELESEYKRMTQPTGASHMRGNAPGSRPADKVRRGGPQDSKRTKV